MISVCAAPNSAAGWVIFASVAGTSYDIPMTRIFTLIAGVLIASAIGPIFAQEGDTAAERQRLGDERARLEAERRAVEGQTKTSAPGQSSVASPATSRSPQDAPAVDESAPLAAMAIPAAAVPAEVDSTRELESGPEPPGNAVDVSQVLDQIRELGELRDAGYVTDEEFDRIKQRILDARF